MPIEDPPRAGFTNSGKPSSATRWVMPSGSRYHSRAVTVTDFITGSPAAASTTFMYALSMLTAEASTPAPTYRTPAISSIPWMVPSSPQGPCRTGKTTSTSPRVVGGCEGSCTTRSVAFASRARVMAARPPSTSGSLSGPVICSVSGSPDSSTQRPSVAMPIGTTSYFVRSMACSTLPAVTQEMACSLDRPPNTTATRFLGWLIACQPSGLVWAHAC